LRISLDLLQRLLGAAILLGLAIWSGLHLAACLQPLQPDPVQGLRRRLGYYPWNPETWFALGHLHGRDLEQASPRQAERCVRTAVSLNPWDYRYWLELARLQETGGNLGEARRSLHTALALNRAYPPLYWQAGNFFLKHGEGAQALRCFRQTLRGDPALLRQVLAICWRFFPDRAALLQEVVPPEPGLLLGAMGWCLQNEDPELALACWRRLLATGRPFELPAAFPLVDHLLCRDRSGQASRVWRQALTATFGLDGQAFRNDVFDGGFEWPLCNGGFGWRAAVSPHLEFRDCPAPRFRGLRSLRIDFDGTENVSGPFLRQYVWLEKPGAYQLEYAILTDRLTGDQGPYFQIDALGAGLVPTVLVQGPRHLEESDWRLINVPFMVAQAGTLVELTCRRDRSRKIDPVLGGRMWLDAVHFRREGPLR